MPRGTFRKLLRGIRFRLFYPFSTRLALLGNIGTVKTEPPIEKFPKIWLFSYLTLSLRNNVRNSKRYGTEQDR